MRRVYQRMKFYGKYAQIRSKLDYSFHYNYPRKRQLFQDTLINQILDHHKSIKHQENPRLIFTAGPMGAGKSHSLKLIAPQLEIDLEKFIHVDPDQYKEMIPEYQIMKEINPSQAGERYHLESAILSEITLEFALRECYNIICDGSMVHHQWYVPELQRIRQSYPNYDGRMDIIYVYASWEKVMERANRRGLVTGRQINPKKLKWVHQNVPKSIEILKDYVDHVYYIDNTEDYPRKLEIKMI